MPRFRGYNPPRYAGLITPDERRAIDNPDGVFSGMTAGLAREDGKHVEVTDMPPDSRDINPLPYFDRDDLFLED